MSYLNSWTPPAVATSPDDDHAPPAEREREELLHLALDVTGLGTWRHDLATGCLHLDERAQRHGGFDTPSVMWVDLIARIQPDDLEAFQRASVAATDPEGDGRHTAEYRVIHEGGEIHWLSVQARVYFAGVGAGRHAMLTIGTSQDITEHKQIQESIRLKDELLRLTGAMAKVGGWEFDTKTLQGTWTEEVARIHDLPPEQETNVALGVSFYSGESRRKMDEAIRAAIEYGTPFDLELELVSATGVHKWVRTVGRPVMQDDQAVRMRGIFQDITERKRFEARLLAALEEKEALLREVHHRVKNNLQAMIALMDMQSGQLPDARTRLFVKELEGQARTMALVYEQLYQSENLARVAMGPYLQQLTAYVLRAFVTERMVQLSLDTPVSLDVATAMPCGLLINELLTNALKHAFPPGFAERPRVSISLQQNGNTYRLIVGDNGVGLPPDFQPHHSRSLGLRLVNLWATHQLGGTLDVTCSPGTVYTITFHADGEE
jgi:two-component sensor histidine kinase/PAS domain-containing protein